MVGPGGEFDNGGAMGEHERPPIRAVDQLLDTGNGTISQEGEQRVAIERCPKRQFERDPAGTCGDTTAALFTPAVADFVARLRELDAEPPP